VACWLYAPKSDAARSNQRSKSIAASISSPTFFDGFGRIALMYVVGAGLIAIFMAPESRLFLNIVQGALAVAFFGTIGDLILESLLALVRS
jgi:hypothetical protein